jgi:hypothetical protein
MYIYIHMYISGYLSIWRIATPSFPPHPPLPSPPPSITKLRTAVNVHPHSSPGLPLRTTPFLTPPAPSPSPASSPRRSLSRGIGDESTLPPPSRPASGGGAGAFSLATCCLKNSFPWGSVGDCSLHGDPPKRGDCPPPFARGDTPWMLATFELPRPLSPPPPPPPPPPARGEALGEASPLTCGERIGWRGGFEDEGGLSGIRCAVLVGAAGVGV